MNGDRTAARPYARAIFEIACKEKMLPFWSQVLAFLAQVAKEEALQVVYHDVRYTASDLSEIFISLLKKENLYHKLSENFIYLLSYYRKLPLLPVIESLYAEHKARLEKTVQVIVTSAFPVSQNIQILLKKALEARLQQEIGLNFLIDKTLMGGAIIRIGDRVIDRSIKSQLEKLKQCMVK